MTYGWNVPATAKHTYGRYTKDAILLLGRLVELNRKQRRMTSAALAERVGISRGTLQRLERGDPKVEIGVFFEAATIVGVSLFETDIKGITALAGRTDDRIVVLPKYVRETVADVDDDF
jgi:transcriptional regulator with XRE-family HTH domain